MHHKNDQCRHSMPDALWLPHSGSSAVAGLRVADRQSHCASSAGTLWLEALDVPCLRHFEPLQLPPELYNFLSLCSCWCWLNAWSQKWEIQIKRQGYRKIFQIWVTEVAEIPALAAATIWIEAGSQMPLVHQLLFYLLMCLRNAKSSTRAAWYNCCVTGWAEVWGIPQMEAQQQGGRYIPSPSLSPPTPASIGTWTLLGGNKVGGGNLQK